MSTTDNGEKTPPHGYRVFCGQDQPREWFRTANTVGFDRPSPREEAVARITYAFVLSNPPMLEPPEPPYGGIYARKLLHIRSHTPPPAKNGSRCTGCGYRVHVADDAGRGYTCDCALLAARAGRP